MQFVVIVLGIRARPLCMTGKRCPSELPHARQFLNAVKQPKY